jgi:hypothetical protein
VGSLVAVVVVLRGWCDELDFSIDKGEGGSGPSFACCFESGYLYDGSKAHTISWD